MAHYVEVKTKDGNFDLISINHINYIDLEGCAMTIYTEAGNVKCNYDTPYLAKEEYKKISDVLDASHHDYKAELLKALNEMDYMEDDADGELVYKGDVKYMIIDIFKKK